MEYTLHFEFVTSVSGLARQEIPEEVGGSEWKGPAKVMLLQKVTNKNESVSVKFIQTFSRGTE